MTLSPSARKLLASPFPILGAWILAGILTIVVPLSKFRRQRQQYYNYAGRYVEYQNNQRNYEQQQKQYQEQQQYQYNNNYGQGNYNQGNYNQQQGNNGQWYQSCSWWQVKCRQNRMAYMSANGDNNNNNIRFPDWYATIGGRTEEDSRDREEMGQNADAASGAVKFVYTWTLIVFIGMLIFGGITIFQRKPLTPLIITMLVIGQFALMQLVLLGQGVIQTEGRQMEDSVYGWFGQLPILMVYSNWGYFLFSIGFSVLLSVKIILDKYVLKDETERPGAAAGAAETSSYKSMDMA